MNPTEAHNQLDVTNLSVSTASMGGRKELIHDVSFSVNRREVLVLLGESGSGKTILSRSLTKLFPPGSGMHIEGSVHFEGQQLLHLGTKELSFIRRRKIRYIFQEPMQSLNPLSKIRAQLRLADDDSSTDETVLNDTLRLAGLHNGEEVLDLYPHQLSIGMAQRVCIAMAVLPAPSLLIADEPTSAVDSSLRYALLDLLVSIRQSSGASLILITHDLDVARSYGDRIIVVYGGRVVESSHRVKFFEEPLHPYSRLLIDAHRQIGNPAVSNIPEKSPAREMPGTGCRFSSRCPIADDKCTKAEPELELTPDGREVRCFYWK
jgi:oligopeptide/dipeptide ABC transporter ATP-binding protein